MATYYVKTGGNDALDGLSPANAWATISKVNAHSFVAGDQVLFNGGDSFSGKVFMTTGGSAGNPAIISSYGTGKATISNSADNAFFISDVGQIEIRNLNITGGATAMGNGSAGIGFFADAGSTYQHILVDNCDITQFTHGVSIGSSSNTSGYNDVTVSNSNLHGNTTNGLTTFGPTFIPASPVYVHSNVSVTSVIAHDNLGDALNTTAATGNGIVLGSVNTATVDYCTAYSNGVNSAYTGAGPVGIWTYDSTNVTIKRCVAYLNATGTIADGDGFDLDINVSNSIIEYCLAYSNYGAGFLVFNGTSALNTRNVVRYNMAWGNGTNPLGTPYGGFAVAGTVSSLDIYNNTFVERDSATSQPYCGWFDGSALTGVTARNNIFYAASGYSLKGASSWATGQVLLQGNAYYRNAGLQINWGGTVYTSLSSWRTAINGQEVVSGVNTGFVGDPLLSNANSAPTVTDPTVLSGAYSLKYQLASPMISSGINLNSVFGTSVGSQDYFGAVVAAPFNIGAASNPTTSPSASLSPSASRSPSSSTSPSSSSSASLSPSASRSPSASVSPSASRSPSGSASSSASPSLSPSASASMSPSSSLSPSASASPSAASFTPATSSITITRVESSLTIVKPAVVSLNIIE